MGLVLICFDTNEQFRACRAPISLTNSPWLPIKLTGGYECHFDRIIIPAWWF